MSLRSWRRISSSSSLAFEGTFGCHFYGIVTAAIQLNIRESGRERARGKEGKIRPGLFHSTVSALGCHATSTTRKQNPQHHLHLHPSKPDKPQQYLHRQTDVLSDRSDTSESMTPTICLPVGKTAHMPQVNSFKYSIKHHFPYKV